MLACVTDCEQISNHPANSSGAKSLHSFPKGPRFLHYSKPYTREVSYDNASNFKKSRVFGKTYDFGHAERPELFPQKEQIQKPAPDTYTLTTAFRPINYAGVEQKKSNRSQTARRSARRGQAQAEQSMRLMKAYGRLHTEQSPDTKATSFGVGREAFDKVVSPSKHNYQPHDRSLPGPGYYQPLAKQIDVNLKYTMRPQTRKDRKSPINSIFTAFRITVLIFLPSFQNSKYPRPRNLSVNRWDHDAGDLCQEWSLANKNN